MNVTRLPIDGLFYFEPQIYKDERGFFFESFNKEKFDREVGYEVNFVQDNHSKSIKNVFRGFHYQIEPRAQGKLVRVVSGEVIDVAVDIRKDSPTFGQYVSLFLSAENRRQFWIPVGFAHGFLTVSDEAEFVYKVTDYYSKEHDRSILYSDPELKISLPETVIVSEKDKNGILFKDADFF